MCAARPQPFFWTARGGKAESVVRGMFNSLKRRIDMPVDQDGFVLPADVERLPAVIPAIGPEAMVAELFTPWGPDIDHDWMDPPMASTGGADGPAFTTSKPSGLPVPHPGGIGAILGGLALLALRRRQSVP